MLRVRKRFCCTSKQTEKLVILLVCVIDGRCCWLEANLPSYREESGEMALGGLARHNAGLTTPPTGRSEP